MTGGTPRPYKILEQQKAPAQPGALFASDTIYMIPSQQSNTAAVSCLIVVVVFRVIQINQLTAE